MGLLKRNARRGTTLEIPDPWYAVSSDSNIATAAECSYA
jgi:hypothetical protein